MNFIQKIYEKICRYFLIREFVFRFDIYNGTETANDIYDAQVVEYHFFNLGNTLCIINDGLYLYPFGTDFYMPQGILLDINKDEMDVTIYKYRFESVSTDEPVNFLMVKSKVKAKIKKHVF